MHMDGAFLSSWLLGMSNAHERRCRWRSLALLLVSIVKAAEKLGRHWVEPCSTFISSHELGFFRNWQEKQSKDTKKCLGNWHWVVIDPV